MPSTDLALHTLRELARNRTSFPQWAPHRRANSRDPTRSRFAPAQVHHETASLPTVTCYRLGHNRPLSTYFPSNPRFTSLSALTVLARIQLPYYSSVSGILKMRLPSRAKRKRSSTRSRVGSPAGLTHLGFRSVRSRKQWPPMPIRKESNENH